MYNNEFENIDSAEKAYVLGLVYADGNIQPRMVRIDLSYLDFQLIKLISKKFQCFKVYNSNKKQMSTLTICSKTASIHFQNNGVFPRKSFENKEKLLLKLRDNLNHFIRGYFDGDGSVSIKEIKTVMYSCNKNLLIQFEDVLLSNGIECKIHINKQIKNNRIYSDMYVLRIRNQSIPLFYEYIYKDSTIHLNRKKNVMENIVKSNRIFIQMNSPNCSHCQSDNTVGNGVIKWKNKLGFKKVQRFLCKKCNKTFQRLTAPLDSNV